VRLLFPEWQYGGVRALWYHLNDIVGQRLDLGRQVGTGAQMSVLVASLGTWRFFVRMWM
jgi:hypothetical protein